MKSLYFFCCVYFDNYGDKNHRDGTVEFEVNDHNSFQELKKKLAIEIKKEDGELISETLVLTALNKV